MVDVEQGKANPWQYLLYRLHALRTFGDVAEFNSVHSFLGNVPASQLSCQEPPNRPTRPHRRLRSPPSAAWAIRSKRRTWAHKWIW